MICFVATNFNNSEFTLRYISSIFMIENLTEFSIVIVDNASTFKERKKLEDSAFFRDERVDFIMLVENVGYFPGLNVGIERSKKNKNTLFWVVGNNDVEFSRDFYQQLSKISAQASLYPIIAPRIQTLDGVEQNPHVINRIPKIRELFYDLYYFNYNLSRIIKYISGKLGPNIKRKDEVRYNEILEIEQGFGACYLITPLFFQNFKSLSSPTFLYHEEAFLQEQLNGKDMKTLYHPNLRVRHSCKAATGKLLTRQKWDIAAKSHWELRQLQRKMRFESDGHM